MQTTKMNESTKARNGKAKGIHIDTGGQAEQTKDEVQVAAQAAAESEDAAAASDGQATVEQPVEGEASVKMIDLDQIVNSPLNPRKRMDEQTLQELSDSIRQSGVLQPICVRPQGDMFEIVFGERRYWAACRAGLAFIPALVREMNDDEVVDAAITENLQREDVKPLEEAAAYELAIKTGRHTVESLIGKFGKSESYIRSRLKLCNLIDSLAEQLDREEISVGVAIEIAKYDARVQQEVYTEHFSDSCRVSWKNARIKEIAQRLYIQYMTRLDSYRFDKTECIKCQHNTANQVLFTDCTNGCAGCQNRECMIRKNEIFLKEKAIKLLKDDPRSTLAYTDDTPGKVLEALEAEGYHVTELEYDFNYYDQAPEMPEEPKAEEYDSEEDFNEAETLYQEELEEFTEQTTNLEYEVSEGSVRKYVVIGDLDVHVRYEELPQEEKELKMDDGHTVIVSVIPPSPIEALKRQDHRNKEICYGHITEEMKKLLKEVKVSNTPLLKEESQMFYYAVMRAVPEERLRQMRIKAKDKNWIKKEERFEAAGHLTQKQKDALMRSFLIRFFNDYNPCSCTDETLDTRLLCRFADLNLEKQSQAVQEKYLKIYEKRRAKLQEQIDAIHAREEEALMAACEQPEPLTEAVEIPVEPLEEPQPEAEPEAIPLYPLTEPDDDEALIQSAA